MLKRYYPENAEYSKRRAVISKVRTYIMPLVKQKVGVIYRFSLLKNLIIKH